MKDTHKALAFALTSRIIIIAVVLISSFLFAGLGFQGLAAQFVNAHQIAKMPFVNLFFRWDSGWYLNIAQNGYPTGVPPATYSDFTVKHVPATVYPEYAFFPLYPAIMRALNIIFLPFLQDIQTLTLIGIIVSYTAFFVSVYFLYKLTLKLFNPQVALVSTVFYSFWVGGVYFSSIYSEALFMALALASFYFLEEKRVYLATFLGFLAAFTRSDGFLVAVPFFVYSIQNLISKGDKRQSTKLLISSGVVASAFLWWGAVCFFMEGNFFAQFVARNIYWGINPNVLAQLLAPYYFPSFSSLVFRFTVICVLLTALPVFYFIARCKKIFTSEARTLPYWAFGASILYLIFTDSYVFSVARYAVAVLPLFWVSAKIYIKSRVAGIILFTVMTALLIVGAYLFETSSWYFL